MKTFAKPNLEVDVFHRFEHLLPTLHKSQYKVIQAIKNCRTEVLGGHKLKCDECDYEKNSYNSCRNRHCPKCQFLTRSKWIEQRSEGLLPCQYFHVVFTLPSELKALMLVNKKVTYNLLFKASSETLKEVAQNPKNLGAEIGFIGVLHTWAQNLMDHPHIHYVVPGGGLSKDHKKWRPCKKDYFLPVKVLSKVFRGKILSMFETAFNKGALQFSGDISYLSDASCFRGLLMNCAEKDFVVYSKETFAGPEQVINYLGNYTHRIAISNYRLVKIEGDRVFFKVRDPKDPAKKKTMSLHAKDFMRRFLLHVLPSGFVRMRHFGLLGNRYKKKNIAAIRALNNIVEKVKEAIKETWKELLFRLTGINPDKCPRCHTGTMVDAFTEKGFLNSS